ncbi:UvrB/UvrC motif-containing protein [Puniceicoccus vermicola]|uniref:UvrB/UvrC motif-containing protein n=1 Tax=Puniceicoccus vermicola TaxID=388746 RepID=A0A7X1B4J1_9BACT|nr:UvrB/UvrC motif-containing protein [Puniceicoccus vermicola]MBC2604260.1 UvrB/UvrC motif-containing protein [Puniceicoccus vermicola]
MAKPKQCIHCGKPATIHLTQIVDGEIRKVDLCESCQFKDSMAADFDIEPFAKLAEGVVAAAQKQSGEVHACPKCGCDDGQLQETGRFGCPDCYEAFEPILPDLLGKIQPGLMHEGKVPVHGIRRQATGKKEAELRKQLESAVREERFEDAAVYRDQLRKLEKEKNDGA